MGELKPDVDLQALNEWFADIPPGPYDALNTTGGWEVRQIDTDPANKHHWPFRLCSSITGQTAGCDAAVFSFIAGVINAWPHLLDADRTEGRGEGEPVAWAYEYTNHLKGDRAPGGWLRAVAFEAPARARVNAGFARNVQPLYASPIREPEISREAVETHLRRMTDLFSGAVATADLRKLFDAERDAILNLAPVAKGASQDAELSDEFDRPGRLSDSTRHSAEGAADPALSGARGVVAPVGGRGEEGSSRSQPGVSAVQQPASSSAQHSAEWRCRRCGRDEVDCRENGCPRGPCPMEFVG